MNLNSYLEYLKNCPDDKLKYKFGISSRWPILLNTNFIDFVQNLKKSEDYTYKKTEGNGLILKHLFNYNPGTVTTGIFEWISRDFIRGYDEDKIKQKENYNITLLLESNQRNKIEGVSEQRALVMAISSFGKIIQQEDLTMCMPFSVPLDGSRDYSKLVTYKSQNLS
jgi:hypothetical protein